MHTHMHALGYDPDAWHWKKTAYAYFYFRHGQLIVPQTTNRFIGYSTH